MSFRHLSVPDAKSVFRGLRTGASFGKISPLFYLCAFVVVAGLILGGGTIGGFLSELDPSITSNSALASVDLENN